jgi:hypothetical protein
MIAGFLHRAIHAPTIGPGWTLDSRLTVQEFKMNHSETKRGASTFACGNRRFVMRFGGFP